MINNECEYFKRKEELEKKHYEPYKSVDIIHKEYMKKYSKEYLVMILIDSQDENKRIHADYRELRDKAERLEAYINGMKGLNLFDSRAING